MAKALRKRVSRPPTKAEGKGLVSGTRRENKDAPLDDTSVPVIQQFQDLIDIQKNEFENVRAGLSQQNVQLARSNSGLMIKVREMDESISELIQENVLLRSKMSLKEHQFKERLAAAIGALEEGVLQRFDEILHMFESVRRKQSLDVPPESLARRSALMNEPRSILKKNGSRNSRDNSTTAIAFSENRNQVFSPEPCISTKHTVAPSEGATSPAAKKRRKSSRRESLFQPSDFEFSDFPANDDTSTTEQPPMTNPSSATTTEERKSPSPEGFEEALNDSNLPPVPLQDSVEESCNFTNSLIEYSIPEELPEKAIESSVTSDTPGKVQVYRDHGIELPNNDMQLLPSTTTNKAQRAHSSSAEVQHPTFVQNATSSQKKVKHSMKSRGSQKRIIDEVMPTTRGSTEDLSDCSRSKRTRGKEINYALPSLRAKMRRPTEKLVDATTVINIRDLQVEGNRRKSGSYSRDGTPLLGEESIYTSQPSARKDTPEVLQQAPPTHGHISAPKESEKIAEKSITSPLSSAYSPNIPKLVPLKDITNKAPGKLSMKTKKLFKKPIVGDLGSENSCSFDESSGNRSTSFRVNEEDLSLLNLLDDLKANTVPKTHRAKARQEAEKRGRKPAFRL
ncbi:LAME_0D01222g1_1 [Lachancea meyersii CBS 8951]|uniref:LAME_0D01222g1_1 n=1 Tax=Lachancea meyersii CBS 8951 TaxID=1266667 RepID=A0A1G4J736_9SACH|nr:LAME_0D01222g1_1 [Lachancea meyersii CBS 8951]